MEVQQQAGLDAAQLQIREQLGFMNWQESLSCLEFHDKVLIDDEVHSIATVQAHRLVDYGQGYLASESQASVVKF